MPIRSEEEYRSATIQAQKFEQAIAAARSRKPSAEVHPRIHEAEIDALESELALLREQLDEYSAHG